jgi:outer membrane cobalamin receptor
MNRRQLLGGLVAAPAALPLVGAAAPELSVPAAALPAKVAPVAAPITIVINGSIEGSGARAILDVLQRNRATVEKIIGGR